MNQVTVSVELEEQVYQALSRYAETVHRDVGVIAREIITEQLSVISLRLDAERIRALPLTERRALARGAWGSWTLTNGTNSVELVRQLRSEWTR